MSWVSRLANVFRSARVQNELDEELEFHMEERRRALIAAGMAPDAAAREVARRFGSPLRLREQSLDVKLAPWLDSLGRDLRLGARMLRKNAVVTAAAVASLALALGASIAAFALVDALVLRRLPVRQPEQLIYLTFPTYSAEQPEGETFSDPVFTRMRDAARGYADLFAMSTQVIRPVRFDGPASEKEPVRTQYVSGDAFDRLGVAAAAGRLLTAQDDLRPGAHPVVVVSHALWTRRFGGDPAVVGRWLTLEDRPFEIVGVAEARFTGVEPGRPTDVWFPYAMYNPRAFGNFNFGWTRVFGRLNANARIEQAQSVMDAAFRAVRRERVYGAAGPNRPPEEIARFLNTPLFARSAASGPSPLRREFERPLWIIASIAGLVLLIAGSNVANLFLARTAAREHEMALRLSIGAGRGRLIQQVLIESALVAAAACLLGLLFAAVAAPAVVAMLSPAGDPVQLSLRMDWRVLAVAGGLTLLTTGLFGLAPALRAGRVAPMTALKSGGARSGSRYGVMRPFVAIQVAFGFVVLFVGSLLVLSFARVSTVNPGFATADVLRLSIETVERVDQAQQRAALLQVLERIRAIPGVVAASSAEYNVLGRAWTHFVHVPGTQREIEATMAPVTSGFLEAMNIPLLAGRAFVARDMDRGAAPTMIVNDTFARRYFGDGAAVGRTLEGRFAMDDDSAGQYEIIGVAADTRYDLRKPAAPTIYIRLPLRMNGTIHVRVAGDPDRLASRLREEVRAASPLFRVASIRSQAEEVARTLVRERLLALLSGFFALVGIVLAAVGLYGVLSYTVMQRTREIGIRVALGARRSGVVRMVLQDAGGTVLAGIAAGLAGGLYLSRFVEALLFEVRPVAFWSVALPLGTLLITALLAATLPARRAVRVDPVVALRYE